MKKLNTQIIIIVLLLVIIGLLVALLWQNQDKNTNDIVEDTPLDSISTKIDTDTMPIAELNPEDLEKKKTTPKPADPAPKEEKESNNTPKSVRSSSTTPNEDQDIPSTNPSPTLGDLFRSDSDEGLPLGNPIDPRYKDNKELENRPRKQGCNMGSHSGENGVAWVRICVNAQGDVVSANFVTRTPRGELSTITQRSQKRLAEECVKQYRYEPKPGSANVCGTVPIYFTTQ